MDEEEINSKFEELLCDMNLDKNKKNLLINSSIDYKDRMLQLRNKVFDKIKENHEFKGPNDYIYYLEQCFQVDSQNPDIILGCLASLKIALTNYPLQWSREFGHKGVATLLDVLKRAKAL
ncbi:protein diaphanous-like [Agrilus planipennis]|uniref:Protein diaphanous-like n=1 Tax=Agrilus planipennis TaxID=224129 RepID=A0A1W4XG19_AGRPL|nr:protein diaphanous-like [Agrilus planipennis]